MAEPSPLLVKSTAGKNSYPAPALVILILRISPFMVEVAPVICSESPMIEITSTLAPVAKTLDELTVDVGKLF